MKLGKNKENLLLAVAFTCVTTNLFSNEVKANADDAIVIVNKFTQKVHDTTEFIQVLSAKSLQERGFSTVNEAFSSIAGINVASNGGVGTSSSLFIQGMANKYMMVLLDSIKQDDPSNISGADLSNLMLSDIEKIEIIKGPQSGIWGANAASGVINIITKKPKKGSSVHVGLEFGSYATKKGKISILHKSEKWDGKISLNRIVSDSFSSISPKGSDLDDFENDPYRNTALNAMLGYNFTKDARVEFDYSDINSQTNYDSNTSDPNSIGKSNYRKKSGYGKYIQKIQNHNLALTLSQTDITTKQITSYTSELNGDTSNVEFKDNLKYKYDDFLFGVSYEKQAVKQKGTFDKTDVKNKSLFVDNMLLVKDLRFSTALRYDDFDRYDDKLTGKVGAKYYILPSLNIYANYGTAYKTPYLTQMINPWGKSNLALEPEKIDGFNVGFAYEGFKLNYFNNRIKNLIAWQNCTTWSDGRYVNKSGTSKFSGVELSYYQPVGASLIIDFNYTYLNAKNSNNKRLLRRPRNAYGLNATYFATKKLILNLNAKYIGDRIDKDYSSYPAATKQSGKYFLANAKATLKVDKNWEVYAKIDNIFDRDYQEVYGYATPKRSFYVGFEARFDIMTKN